jgi:hypothetical protein
MHALYPIRSKLRVLHFKNKGGIYINLSLRDISQIMDPLEPPTSLKELANRHRWMSGSPPNPISIRSITDRYSQQENIIRFLSYNTFLLDGFEIPLNLFDLSELLLKLKMTPAELILKLGIGIPELITKLGIDAAQVLARKYGSEGLANALGVAEDVKSTLEDVLNFITFGAFDWAKVAVEDVLGVAEISPLNALMKLGLTPLEILKIMGIDPLEALIRLGIGIANVLGADIPDPLTAGAKPALNERAREIGPKLMVPMSLAPGLDKSYEIIALCEVWTQEARNQIAAATPLCAHITGPDKIGSKALKGSGLYQIVLNHHVLEQHFMVFNNRGDELRDADAWASKGVLLTRIDVGVGVIDLYGTHLYSGDGLLDLPSMGLGKLSEAEKSNIRNAQLDEFIIFFEETHMKSNRSNIAIFCGDFNIAANKDLIDKMNTINMEDVALRPPVRPDAYEESGGTHGDEDAGSDRFNAMCDISKDTTYCRDPNGKPSGECIDYIFIERPTKDHAFNLDISRLRRRLFPRDQATDGQYFLSDHLGLDVTLVASKRKY